MPAAIWISSDVVVPEAALSLRTSRASGPGGQNVNKVASKVELRVDLSRIEGLPPDARARLDRLTRAQRDADGLWRVTSQRTRDQGRNLEDARGKIRDLVARALRPPRVRRPTRPTAAATQRRLAAKKHASRRKRGRSRVASED